MTAAMQEDDGTIVGMTSGVPIIQESEKGYNIFHEQARGQQGPPGGGCVLVDRGRRRCCTPRDGPVQHLRVSVAGLNVCSGACFLFSLGPDCRAVGKPKDRSDSHCLN